MLPESLASAAGVKLYPGMPADVLIINKPRLAIDYLLSPITDSLNAAFHEDESMLHCSNLRGNIV